MKIRIVSGEGEHGSMRFYGGRTTLRAIYSALKKERRGGRWARLEIWTENGWRSLLSDEMKDWLEHHNYLNEDN